MTTAGGCSAREPAASTRKPRVLVMMATYNGERHLQEQIDTVMAQEGADVRLLVSDDCSTDSTCAICGRNAASDPRVEFRANGSNVGVGRNFMNMLYSADPKRFDYFAFSDQDDFWLPGKLSRAVACIEGAVGAPEARLYYSDVTNVDSELHGGAREYYPFERVQGNLKTLLARNWASGCTMVLNSAFCELAQAARVDEFPRYHDAWLHLIALSAEGACAVADLSYSGILRRITGSNAVGERGFGRFGARRVAGHLANLATPPSREASRTALLLLDAYGDLMGAEELEAVLGFLECRYSAAARLRTAADPGFRMPYAGETALIRLKTLFNRW